MANRYFKSTATVWNSANSWSAVSSLSVDNAGVPTSSDAIIFDANSGAACAIDVNAVGTTINQTGYTGTITQTSSFTLTLSGTWTFPSGAFLGGSGNITCFTIVKTGGALTSTSGTFQIGVTGGAYAWDETGGTFAHNNGLVKMVGSNHSAMRNLASYPFYKVELNQCVSCNNTGTIYVDNEFKNTLTGAGGGLIVNLKGNLINTVGGNFRVNFIGSANQTITCASGAGNSVGTIEINKTGGTVKLLTDLEWNGHWYSTAGNALDPNGFTVYCNISFNTAVIQSPTFYNFVCKATAGVDLANGYTNNIICLNDYTRQTGAGFVRMSPITVGGNVVMTTLNPSPYSDGILTLNGTGTQNISATGSTDIISINVNKPSGSAKLISNFTIIGSANDFNLIAGTFDQNGFNFTVPDTLNQTGGIYIQGAGILDIGRFTETLGTFNEGSQGIICRGTDFFVAISAVFNRSLIGGGLFANTAVGTALLLTMNGWTLSNFSFARLTASLTLGSSLVINGYYKKSSTANTANVIGAGFTIRIGGNVEQNNIYSSRVLATSPTFIFNGVSDQTVTSSDGKLDSGIWQVNKPSGKVTQISAITVDNGQAGDNLLNNLVILSGAWCTNNFNLTVDGTIVVLSSAELRKTPSSVITGTIGGVITNVNSCEEKKTLFFLVE
jgi:hypothetical protein